MALYHKGIEENRNDNEGNMSRHALRFVTRYSTGNNSGKWHLARLITQPDWGFLDITFKTYRDYYSPSGNDHATWRWRGYYSSHNLYQVAGNDQFDQTGLNNMSYRQDLGPGGAFQIHAAANGGYYRDAWATDLYLTHGTYTGTRIEWTVYNSGGYLLFNDDYPDVTSIYPAPFEGQASQAQADSWTFGRGIWFNTSDPRK